MSLNVSQQTENCLFCKVDLSTSQCECGKKMIAQAELESIKKFEDAKVLASLPQIPNILKAGSSYFWSSQQSASQRRSREEYYLHQVQEFLELHNFQLTISDSITATKTITISSPKGKKQKTINLEVYFYYSESCKHVYKKFTLELDGKKSTKTKLFKLLGYPKIE